MRKRLNIKKLAIYAMLGAMMFASDILMEGLPNIHIVGVMIVASTVAFRSGALYPLYIYVVLNGLYTGFGAWWVPYLYVWTVLWAMTMLLPKRMPKWLAPIVYMLVCALHGLMFGALYAPLQALMFGFSFEQTLLWIANGLYFDLIHCVGNLCLGVLIVPIIRLLRMADRN